MGMQAVVRALLDTHAFLWWIADSGRLPGHNRDPFDRMLVAQALAHDLTIVSVDEVFDRYGVNRL